MKKNKVSCGCEAGRLRASLLNFLARNGFHRAFDLLHGNVNMSDVRRGI